MRLCGVEEEAGADSWAEGERSRRGPGLALLPLSGAAGEADEGRMRGDLSGVGGLAELERLRVDMADLMSGMDDRGLLSADGGGSDEVAAGVVVGSDMAVGGWVTGGKRQCWLG